MLSAAGKAFLVGHIKLTSAERERGLINEGDKGKNVFFIIEGYCGVYIETRIGPLMITQLGPGDFFGEIAVMNELVSDVGRTASIRSLNDVTLAAMSSANFKQLCADNPQVVKGINDVYTDRQEQLNALKEALNNT